MEQHGTDECDLDQEDDSIWVQISELKYFNFDFNLEEGQNIKI